MEDIKRELLKNIDIIAKNLYDNKDILLKKSSNDTIKVLAMDIKNVTLK